MIKRILAVSLALLLCIPFLGFIAAADELHIDFVTSADTEGTYIYPGTIAEGAYTFSGECFSSSGSTISIPELQIVFQLVEIDGISALVAVTDFLVDGLPLMIACVPDSENTVLMVVTDKGPLFGSFVLSSVSDTGSSSGSVFVLNQSYSGDFLPPEGHYTMELTFNGKTTVLPVELIYNVPSGVSGYKSFKMRVDRGNELFVLEMVCFNSMSYITVMDRYDQPVSGTVVFIPKSQYNGLPVLLRSVGSALNSVVQFCGFVVNSLLAPGGAFSPLWPLIGTCVAFALVPVGVALIERFRP